MRRVDIKKKSFKQDEKYKINRRIKAESIRLISEKGEQIGIKPIKEALNLAEEAGLDLVEIAPDASPPVCKLIDYGKFKYQLQKKEAEAKKKRTDNAVKEIKIGYRTDVGDLNTKTTQARKFLLSGNKVKISMRFRGRERSFINLGQEKLNLISEKLADCSNLDEKSNFRGGQIYLVLSPIKADSKK